MKQQNFDFEVPRDLYRDRSCLKQDLYLKSQNLTSLHFFQTFLNCIISHINKEYWNEILYNSEMFEKNVGMLDFVILDIDLALNRYCLRSWSRSAHALLYAIVLVFFVF